MHWDLFPMEYSRILVTMLSSLEAGEIRGEVGVGTGNCTLGECVCEVDDKDRGGTGIVI
jgi:hypothetical protein